MSKTAEHPCLLTRLTTQLPFVEKPDSSCGRMIRVQIMTEPLTANAFSPFGEVIEMAETPPSDVGNVCLPAADEIDMDMSQAEDVPVAVSLLSAQPVASPFMLWSIESHALNSRTVLPLSAQPHVVVVAENRAGAPGAVFAFLASGKQGVKYGTGVWHHAPLPVERRQQFSVIDSLEPTADFGIQRRFLERPWIVGLPS